MVGRSRSDGSNPGSILAWHVESVVMSKGRSYLAGISFVGISLNGIPSLDKRENFSSWEFFFWVRLGLWLSLDAAVSFCPDVVGNRKGIPTRKGNSPSQVPSEIFLRRGNFSDRPDPNQVGQFKEIPT